MEHGLIHPKSLADSLSCAVQRSAATTFGHSNVASTRAARGGFAIVMVLSFLALILVLVLAFFLTTATELESAKSYARGATAKELGDSAVQLAMASIRTATTTGADVAWASQPGMIRTYNNSGTALSLYKLYSSDQMVQTKDAFSLDAELNVKGTGSTIPWNNSPAFFTDLNSPLITSGAGTASAVGSFPIIDGNGMTLSAGNLVYPGTTGPEGFSVDSSKISYVPGTLTATNNPVPVPAKWLYVLENGKIVAPTLPTGGNGKIAVVPGADTSPIVGRIAFWTDDETSKVNINTASEGTFWDMPRAEGATERGFGSSQPWTHEYQRYAGHPATTSLSTVFPRLITSDNSAFYALTPRVASTGASAGATPSPQGVKVDHDRLYTTLDELLYNPARAVNPTSTPLSSTDLQRARFVATAYNRAPEVNLYNKPRITIWPIDASFKNNPNNNLSSTRNPRVTPTDQLIAFCSTMRNDLGSDRYPYYFQRANPNSASELTDIARNNGIYSYLQTLTAKSVPGFGGDFLTKYANDRDQILTEIFDYVRTANLTDAALGGGLSGGTVTTISRPSYAPARTIAVTNALPGLPGFNDSYAWGYGLVTPTSAQVTSGTPTRGFGRMNSVSGGALWFIGAAGSRTGATATAVINDNQDGSTTTYPDGTGTPTTATTVAMGPKPVDNPIASNPPIPVDRSNTANPGFVRVQALFALEFFCPAYNWPATYPCIEYTIDGLDAFSWCRDGEATYKPMGFPAALASGQRTSYWKPNQYPGGRQGLTTALSQKLAPLGMQAIPQVAPTTADKGKGFYPYISGSANMTANINGTSATIATADFPVGSKIHFKGGPVTIKIYFNSSSLTDTPIQTIHMTVPEGVFPVPVLASSSNDASGVARNFRRFFGPLGSAAASTANPTPPKEKDGYYSGVPGRFSRDDVTGPTAFFSPNDVVREMVVGSGDHRMAAGQTDAPDSLFIKHPQWDEAATSFAHCLWTEGQAPITNATLGTLANGASYGTNLNRCWWSNIISTTGVAAGKATGFAGGDVPGDWDNGMSDQADGPYINKVDEGNRYGLTPGTETTNGVTNVPYFIRSFLWTDDPNTGQSYFSPNRQLPSAGMFGSLPTGVNRNRPWQTLLFRPGPSGHAGLASPPDHLLMDLFTMPVAEPYAISEPFSTAGKVNMNYQIMPYTYITRETAIRAALKSEQIMAIPTADGANYKSNSSNTSYRFTINLTETMNGFKTRFANNDLFRSASEICSIYLVPNKPGVTYSSMGSFWDSYRLTGDNTRERPYANIYPRLTTKSNTFTVHYRAQALKKNPNRGLAAQWDESSDAVVGEFRGSSVVERYIDPNDPSLPDFVTTPSATVDSYYRLHVLSTKQFNQ